MSEYGELLDESTVKFERLLPGPIDRVIPRPEKYKDMPERMSFAGNVTRCEPPSLHATTP